MYFELWGFILVPSFVDGYRLLSWIQLVVKSSDRDVNCDGTDWELICFPSYLDIEDWMELPGD